jgi:hypothetical protein
MMAVSSHGQVVGRRTRPMTKAPCSQSVICTARDGVQWDSTEVFSGQAAPMSTLIRTDSPSRSGQRWCSLRPSRSVSSAQKNLGVLTYSILTFNPTGW